MATFPTAANIGVNAAINYSGSVIPNGTTLYQAPADGYAILSYVDVNGTFTIAGVSKTGAMGTLSNSTHAPIYLGPSQTIVTTAANLNATIRGVEFRNTN